jgi:hypothetical protein
VLLRLLLDTIGRIKNPTKIARFIWAYEDGETQHLAFEWGHTPVVAPKKNRKNPWEYDKELYKQNLQSPRFYQNPIHTPGKLYLSRCFPIKEHKMNYLNSVFLEGEMTGNPDYRSDRQGNPVCRFSKGDGIIEKETCCLYIETSWKVALQCKQNGYQKIGFFGLWGLGGGGGIVVRMVMD